MKWIWHRGCVCICVNLGRTTAGNKEEGKTRFPIMKENFNSNKREKEKLKQNEESYLVLPWILGVI